MELAKPLFDNFIIIIFTDLIGFNAVAFAHWLLWLGQVLYTRLKHYIIRTPLKKLSVLFLGKFYIFLVK
ncbi:LOW QUALITY PROTEIN: hypothetical protein HZS_5491 [Henneguya salminicola]|nr:LOW QUALITY PROTEIN: hypothetical protein HZS_5491 [Henneguya salminicola]